MTVFFAGGEETDFVRSGSINVVTTASHRRTAWSREALAIGPDDYIMPPDITPTSILWCHSQTYFITNNASGTLNRWICGFFSPDNIARLAVRGTGTGGQLKLSKVDSANTYTDLATSASGLWTAGSLHQIDVEIDYSTNGRFALYFNASGTPAVLYTGDVTTDSATTLSAVLLTSPTNLGDVEVSEVVLGDFDTRVLSGNYGGLYTMPPQAAAATQQWTGAVGDINETTLNDSTYITTSTNNNVSEWTAPTTFPSSQSNILAMIQTARSRIGIGLANYQWVIHPASGSAQTSSTIAGTFALEPSYKIWETNPQTSAEWTFADIGSGFSYGIKGIT